MRHAITAGFDCNANDLFDDVLEDLTKALKRFDIQLFVTPNSDDETLSISLYKFLDETEISIKPPQFDQILLDYLADAIGKGNEQ